MRSGMPPLPQPVQSFEKRVRPFSLRTVRYSVPRRLVSVRPASLGPLSREPERGTRKHAVRASESRSGLGYAERLNGKIRAELSPAAQAPRRAGRNQGAAARAKAVGAKVFSLWARRAGRN